MYSSWSTDLHEIHAHQRKIVRHFDPFMSDAELSKQERRYLFLGISRVIVVFILPSLPPVTIHTWFLTSPVFALVLLVSFIELMMAMYRFIFLHPEGLQSRLQYWRTIESSEDSYRLKILGYYHRKINQFVGHYPRNMASSKIQHESRVRCIFLITLFTSGYIIFMVFLGQATDKEVVRIYVLYLLAIGAGMVVFRLLKMILIEIPQALRLRDHPDFALDFFTSDEKKHFARSVPTYNSTSLDKTPSPILTKL